MTLAELGYDSWCEERYRDLMRPDFSVARVTRVDKDRYMVCGEHDEVSAEPTGRLMFSADANEDLPCVGDWVLVQYYNDGGLAIIHEVLPRKSYIRRKAAGRKMEFQMIAANIDTAFVMQSCDHNFNVRRMERYLVMIEEGHVAPGILLSKQDLVGEDDLNRMMEKIRQARISAPVIPFSSRSGAGRESVVRALLPGKTYCLLGSSGVGKTTLLNHLLGGEVFDTHPVRASDSRGRHTTSRRQLTVLDTGALLIDTPGMRELGLMAVGAQINESFSDIQSLAAECRFGDCSHTVEAGCAILNAMETGTLSEERYKRYRKLLKESEFHEMSYAERRRKDKQFGRMVKSVLQDVKKRKGEG